VTPIVVISALTNDIVLLFGSIAAPLGRAADPSLLCRLNSGS